MQKLVLHRKLMSSAILNEASHIIHIIYSHRFTIKCPKIKISPPCNCNSHHPSKFHSVLESDRLTLTLSHHLSTIMLPQESVTLPNQPTVTSVTPQPTLNLPCGTLTHILYQSLYEHTTCQNLKGGKLQ